MIRFPRPHIGLRFSAMIALGTVCALLFSGMNVIPARAAPGPTDFASSFEDSEPVKPAKSTPEAGADGKPVGSGVSGAGNTDLALKDSILDSVRNVSASGENPPNEVAGNLKDGSAGTKWLVFSDTGWAQYQLDAAHTVKSYSLTSGGDAPLRDPVDWDLQGSADGQAWTTVDSQRGQSFADRGLKKLYPVAVPGSYQYYRLSVTKTGNSGILQLADWDLASADLPVPEPGTGKTMDTAVGNGPGSGYNVKSNAGFTGVRALKYSGTKTQAGRAFALNKLFDVNLPVLPGSRLSYKIIPGADYTDYLATYAAVDLHFTDGSYLSELSPVDQNGVPLTAAGQGEGKILFAAQWNYVLSEIGAVAAGKTIDRILLRFDNTAAPAQSVFSGWIDDLKIEGTPNRIDGSSKTNFVDTRRGSNSSGSFSRGNNLPITAVPNGFNFLAPVTNASVSNWEYDYQSANNASNQPTLQGLAVSHIPSPWMGDRNQFSVMPAATATPSASKSARALAFSHDQEVAQPDYYRVQLAGGVKAEMTASDHGALMRFGFEGAQRSLVFDSPKGGARFSFDGSTVTGTVPAQGGSGQGDMYLYGSFDTVPSSTLSAPAAAVFAGPAPAGGTVTLRFATSFIDQAQARRNFDLEVAGRSFEEVRAAARELWNARLGVIDVEGANDSQQTTLYSNLYRLNLYPNSGFENTGTAAAPKYQYRSPVSQDPATGQGRILDGKIYVNNGFWDTYRTAWPAYSLLYPEKAAELADGFVQQYRDGGWIARWSSPGYADLMTGTSSDVSFADAYLKGVPLPDPLGAYDAAVRNATVPSIGNSAVGRKGLTTSVFTGYTSSSTGESVSWGLEGFINDFGLGNMAAKLAADPATPDARRAQLKEDSAYYLNRAQYYVNMFDAEQGFFNGRSPGGEFQAGLDPESWGGLFTETDGWNFAFHAPQDGRGLAALYGGPKGLENKLDAFFATPENADKPGGYGGVIHEMVEARAVRMGQLGMSNQPSHHIPYIYNYAGAPAKTQAVVREIQRRLFVGSEIGQGYPGDEDNGEMSSWNIFSTLGFYPLQVGSAHFSIGSPQFSKATVRWGNGKTLVINARNNSTSNVYVQSMSINGKAHDSTTLDQSDIADGGSIDFVMGPNPSNWGAAAEPGPVPEPIMDTTKDAVLRSSGGEDLKTLSDDNSASQVSFSVPAPVISLDYPAGKQKASFYTLTSGSTASGADPAAWTLEGSNDGSAWTELDRRQDVRFDWRLQTKPFQISTPTPFAHYRLSIAASRSGDLPVLAELELLAKASDAVPGDLAVTAAKGITAIPGVDTRQLLGTVGGGAAANGYTATVDWGDGTAVTPATVAGTGVVRPVSASHNYAKPGVYQVTVTASDGLAKQSAALLATVELADASGLASAFDKVCLGDDPGVPDPAAANCDSVGYAFSRQALAAAGVVQGVPNSLQVDGKTLAFTLPAVPPGAPDNAMGSGQKVKLTLSKEATVLSFIGTGTQGNQDVSGTVGFTDGSSAPLPMQLSDWTLGATPDAVPAFGNTVVAKAPYRLAGTAKDGAIPFLFATKPYRIPDGKTVASVTLPQQAGAERDGRIHVFAVATDGAIVPPPVLRAEPASGISAELGGAVEATLGTASGGSPGLSAGQAVPGEYSARIYWGDGSPTEDAGFALPGPDLVAAITAQHRYSATGSFTAALTVSDANGSRTVQIPVTVKPAAKPQPELKIDPAGAVRPGAPVAVTGSKFDAGEKVSLDFGSVESGSVQQLSADADATGSVAFRLTVPQDAKPGVYPVRLRGASSQIPVSGTVLVEAATPPVSYSPNARLEQSSAARGETVRFSGDSFAPGELVSISLHSEPLLLGTAQADAHGILNGEFTVPDAAALGAHQVVLTGAVSNKPVAIGFTVAEQTVGPNPGDPGGSVPLPGSGAGAQPDGQLSGTGFDGTPLALAGFGALFAGAALLLGVRRRRS